MSTTLPSSRDIDAELVAACQESKSFALDEGFRQLYLRHKDRVYNVCCRMTGNATDALDASQETFSILFRRLDEFGFRSRFSSWVYRIAINASIDLMRREWRNRVVLLDSGVQTGNIPGPDLDPPTRDPQDMPREATARHELPSIVQGAIDRLSPKLREVAVLRYSEDLTYDDIAESLEISLGTVKSRLARAHQALRVSLGPALEDGRST